MSTYGAFDINERIEYHKIINNISLLPHARAPIVYINKKMSGRVTGGKGKGPLPKRHHTIHREAIRGITKNDLRRLARRGGVKRMSSLIYDESRDALKSFLVEIIQSAVTYTTHARRATVSNLDVVYALKRHGRTLYGFGG